MNKIAKIKEQNTAIAAAEFFEGQHLQIPIGAPLPQITILRETPMFELPDGSTVKTIQGHIIFWHHANQYYETEFGSGEQGPPTCASSDGIKPDGGMQIQAASCLECPKNQYGSDKEGRGKACQNTIRLYILQDGDVIPSVLKATPSSLSKKDSLMRWLTNAPNITARAGLGTAYQVIKAQFSLHKKEFNSGFSASVLDVQTIRVLDTKNPEDLTYIKKLSAIYKDFVQHYKARIAADVATETQATQNDDDNIPI